MEVLERRNDPRKKQKFYVLSVEDAIRKLPKAWKSRKEQMKGPFSPHSPTELKGGGLTL